MQQTSNFQLQLDQAEQLEFYLKSNGWLDAGATLQRTEKPGEGNMNCVVRAISASTSLIVKQARPWVEKYPSIAAPTERALVEAKFYQTVQQRSFFREKTPRLLGFDPLNFVLVLEDLGSSADFLHLYHPNAALTFGEAKLLGDFLSELHHLDLTAEEQAGFPENLALRRLNHEHIFRFPYRNDTGFDLNTVQLGLQAAAQPFRSDRALTKRIEELGEIYLSEGKTLLHGDYYPGSWLRTAQGLRIIDPEFCFLGAAEFDHGVLWAHALLSHLNDADRQQLLDAYQAPQGFDQRLATAFAGAEIIRRLIGLAQLPLERSLSEKTDLLERAKEMVLS